MAVVMVVDDDPDVLAVLVRAVTGGGHQVIEVPSGLAALDVLDRGTQIDLLLTDVVMPGLNGFNLARMARMRRPELRVLYVTGYWETETVQKDQGLRFGNLLKKPVRPDRLLAAVKQALAA